MGMHRVRVTDNMRFIKLELCDQDKAAMSDLGLALRQGYSLRYNTVQATPVYRVRLEQRSGQLTEELG